MDRAKMEFAGIEEMDKDTLEKSVNELSELQLTLAGGGSADPIYH